MSYAVEYALSTAKHHRDTTKQKERNRRKMNGEQAKQWLNEVIDFYTDNKINKTTCEALKTVLTELEQLHTELDKAIEEVKTERDKCYLDEYCYSHGWGMQSALEIFERHIEGAGK